MATKRLTLSHDGVHWNGTFTVLLEALARDLLPEGPVQVELTVLGDADTEHGESGSMVAVDADGVHLADGRVFPLDRLLAVAVD